VGVKALELSKQKATLVRAGCWALGAAVAYLILRYLIPFLLPFLIGFFIAWMLRPVAAFISRHSGMGRRGASIISAVALYLVVGILLWLAGVWIADWCRAAAKAMPTFFRESVAPVAAELWRRLGRLGLRFAPQGGELVQENAEQLLAALGESLSAKGMEWLGAVAKGVPTFLLALVFAIISSVLICADYDKVTAFVMRQLPAHTREAVLEVRDFLASTLWKLIKAYLILMLITFVLLSAGLWLLRIERFWMPAAVTALLDLMPVIGSGLVLIPWGVYHVLGGEYATGIGLLVVWVALSAAREILEPKIVGDQIGLHPLTALVSMYVGFRAAGFAGLLILPVLCLLLQYMQRRGFVKLFK